MCTADPALATHNSHVSRRLSHTARRWTLGEIITAFAQAGLVIEALEEMAVRQSRLPNWFVLVARKP